MASCRLSHTGLEDHCANPITLLCRPDKERLSKVLHTKEIDACAKEEVSSSAYSVMYLSKPSSFIMSLTPSNDLANRLDEGKPLHRRQHY
jgi:hypothetical protein